MTTVQTFAADDSTHAVMRVCSITPHLPPEQAANALLPRQLGDELASHGVTTIYVAHPPASGVPAPASPGTAYVARRGRGVLARTRAGALLAAVRMTRGAAASIRSADLVHLHGNGFIVETARFLAERWRKPYVITLYGTDVWHHDPGRHRRFASVVHGARHRIFYSQGLLEFARPLGLAAEPSSVIYAPVPPTFLAPASEVRAALRRELGVGEAPLLLTVKRLHEVAGHDVLLRALTFVARGRPDVVLWIVGEGDRRAALEAQVRDLGLGSRVRFLGMLGNETLWRLYAAADLFVLPSRLESWGTVMLESLACGTRVVATDTVGGYEVHAHFPEDVMLAPRENPEALAAAIARALAGLGRVGEATAIGLRAEFSVAGCAARYLGIYRSVLHAG